MGGLTFLEQLCSVTMLLAGTGAMLLLYAGLALSANARRWQVYSVSVCGQRIERGPCVTC